MLVMAVCIDCTCPCGWIIRRTLCITGAMAAVAANSSTAPYRVPVRALAAAVAIQCAADTIRSPRRFTHRRCCAVIRSPAIVWSGRCETDIDVFVGMV